MKLEMKKISSRSLFYINGMLVALFVCIEFFIGFFATILLAGSSPWFSVEKVVGMNFQIGAVITITIAVLAWIFYGKQAKIISVKQHIQGILPFVAFFLLL